MKLKSILCVAAAAAMCAGALTACGDGKTAETKDAYKVYMPDGAPAIAMAELMHSGYPGAEFNVVPANTIKARVSGGDADFAIMPVNAAATLYNSGVKITMLSVNTHGNLYFVGDAKADMQLGDLVGKRVGVIGRGEVPDLTLRMMLDKSGISYDVMTGEDGIAGKVALCYRADGPSLLPLLKQGKIDYAFLAEPAATNAVNNFQKSIVMDAQKKWQQLFDGDYPQACLVVKNSVLGSDAPYVKWFLRALESSDGWSAAHPDLAVKAVKDHMISGVESTLPATLTAEVIKRCNISTVYASDAKATCAAYFTRLTQMTGPDGDPVLTAVPDDGFYYNAQA